MDDLQSEGFTLYRSHLRKRCSEYALVLRAQSTGPSLCRGRPVSASFQKYSEVQRRCSPLSVHSVANQLAFAQPLNDPALTNLKARSNLRRCHWPDLWYRVGHEGPLSVRLVLFRAFFGLPCAFFRRFRCLFRRAVGCSARLYLLDSQVWPTICSGLGRARVILSGRRPGNREPLSNNPVSLQSFQVMAKMKPKSNSAITTNSHTQANLVTKKQF